MTVVKVTDAATEPVTLAEAKAHCRVDATDDDTLITALIVAARNAAEHELQRTCITTVYKLTLDEFPDVIDLPLPTIQSVASVKYYNDAGTLTTLDPSLYWVDLPAAVILPASDWPTTQLRPAAVEVSYTAGWANAAAVPETVKQWIKLFVGSLYDNRASQANAKDATTELPFVGSLLDPYRVRVL